MLSYLIIFLILGSSIRSLSNTILQGQSDSFVAKELSRILRNNEPDDSLFEQSHLFDLLTASEFLTEEEVGPLLVKYRTVTPSAENALKSFSSRKPEALPRRMAISSPG